MPTRAKVDGQEDAIAITRAAWAQPVVRYHGRVYSADDLGHQDAIK